MVLCLSIVCLVCSAILAVTYVLTLKPIQAAQEAKTNASVAKVLPAFEGTSVLSKATLDGNEYKYYSVDGTGYAFIVDVAGFGGPVSVMVGITGDGTVYDTAVLSHSETPGLGAKCLADEKFVGQFRGFDPSARKLAVSKDGGNIDAVSGCTITSRAFTLAVATATRLYSTILEQGGTQNE